MCQFVVAGLVLGRASGDELRATNTIPISHTITDSKINLDPELIKNTLAAMSEVDPTEELIGWYRVSGGSAPLDLFSVKLHEYFAGELPSRRAAVIAAVVCVHQRVVDCGGDSHFICRLQLPCLEWPIARFLSPSTHPSSPPESPFRCTRPSPPAS